MKIVVTFSGLDPSRLGEHIDRRLRERRATRAAVTRPRFADAIGSVAEPPPPSPPPRPVNRRSRRDRRS